jgi:hypothetical protein
MVPLMRPVVGPGTMWTKGAQREAWWINDEGGIERRKEG